MEALQAIFSRQSVGKLKPDPVPQTLIEKVLAAAAQAPNHYRVRPWRFIVLTGAAREQLGEVFAEGLRQRQPNLPPAAYEKERNKPLRAPALIAVAAAKPSTPRELLEENVAAAAAATQNLLLAAHALGLAAKWRTGAPASDPAVKAFLGLEADQPLVAFVYLGYPAVDLPAPNRPDHTDRTTWMHD